jgi:hypothetical protein
MLSRNDTSRMMREYHVRFCERLEGETPSCLLGVPFVFFANPRSINMAMKQLLYP